MKNVITKIRFARVGGLSSVPQKGYDASMPSEHSPPKRRGIYAFVWPHLEWFLLGGENAKIGKKHAKFNWHRDKEGNRVEAKPDDDMGNKYWTEKDPKDDKWYYTIKKDIKIFDYTGNLWHHLKVSPKDIIDSKGSWTLTSFEAYTKALRKEIGSMEASKKRNGWETNKDHLEVFIEKV